MTNAKEIQGIIKVHFRNLYATKFEKQKQKQIDTFLDTSHLAKLMEDQINNLNSSKIPRKIEAVIKSAKQTNKKSSWPDGFIVKFYQTLKKR